MSYYLSITSEQSPFDIGEDRSERSMLSCNYDCTARAPVSSFLREIGRFISDAGLGTFGTDMFLGRGAILPKGDGPYVSLINTGGDESIAIQNDAQGHSLEELSVQIVVRAAHYEDAETRALAIWRVLDGIRNTTVTA